MKKINIAKSVYRIKSGIAVLLFLAVQTICHSQVVKGEYAFGGSNYDGANSIAQTKDSGFFLGGITYGFGAGGSDVYLVKLDKNANLEWTKTIGGTGNEQANFVLQNNLGYYGVIGSTTSYGAGSADIYICVFDNNGNLTWANAYGGAGDDEAYSVGITRKPNSGGAVVGRTSSFGMGGNDVYVLMVNLSGGTVRWSKTIGGSGNEQGNSVVRSSDDGVVLTGYTTSFGAGQEDIYVVKFDSNGALKWTRTIGGSGSDIGNSIIRTHDNGYAIAGQTNSYGAGGYDVYIIKLDSNGNLKWTKTIGGRKDDIGHGIVETSDYGLAITGTTVSFNDTVFGDCYLIKLDSAGNLLWTKTYGSNVYDYSYSLVNSYNNDGFVLAGLSDGYGSGNYDVFLIKTDSLGNSCLASGSGGIISSGGIVDSGGTVSSGYSLSSGGIIDSGGSMTNVCSILTSEKNTINKGEINSFPNPGNGKYTIECYGLSSPWSMDIYNIFGEKVYSLFNIRNARFNININDQPDGIYFYNIHDKDGNIIGEGKMVIEK